MDRETVEHTQKEQSTFQFTAEGFRHKGLQRRNQEDNFFISTDKTLPVFVVADGAGGHQAGEIASELVVETFKKTAYDNGTDCEPSDFLQKTIQEANRKIVNERKQRANNMLTTVCALALRQTGESSIEVTAANVGDSRAYVFRKNERHPLLQITKDDSLVQELIDSGSLTEAQARRHPQRNIITKALGSNHEVKAEITTFYAGDGDVLLLCTDGLENSNVSKEFIQVILRKVSNGKISTQDASRILVEEANRNGGLDNSASIVIKIKKSKESKRSAKQYHQQHYPHRQPMQSDIQKKFIPYESSDPLTIKQMGEKGLFDLTPSPIFKTYVDNTGRIIIDISKYYSGEVKIPIPNEVLRKAYQHWERNVPYGNNIVAIPVSYGGKWYCGGINAKEIEQLLDIKRKK